MTFHALVRPERVEHSQTIVSTGGSRKDRRLHPIHRVSHLRWDGVRGVENRMWTDSARKRIEAGCLLKALQDRAQRDCGCFTHEYAGIREQPGAGETDSFGGL